MENKNKITIENYAYNEDMLITKNGTTINLNHGEFQQIVKVLPWTLGGSY